jgi:hypothetical protein
METRFTPASRKAAKRPASALVGLASSVISASGSRRNSRPAAAMSAATLSGAIRLGVPPPKKMEVTRLGPSRAASHSSSASSAWRIRAWGRASRTWELKSQ